jgi:hypothetical protein
MQWERGGKKAWSAREELSATNKTIELEEEEKQSRVDLEEFATALENGQRKYLQLLPGTINTHLE